MLIFYAVTSLSGFIIVNLSTLVNLSKHLNLSHVPLYVLEIPIV